ncbi:hypothetical protein GOODEAATRI_024864 [Goodea atripinnis]|uniref:G domain-containing protein n=1 Tax=Goodea atripinnis TaxID=208336 RepID=A0ABV0PGV4_9TELE
MVRVPGQTTAIPLLEGLKEGFHLGQPSQVQSNSWLSFSSALEPQGPNASLPGPRMQAQASMQKRNELMESIKTYKPTVSSVPQARVLLIGQVGAGKSSFFNSINSVFRGHVTSQAISGSSSTSLTTQFRTYSLKAGREGKPLPIVLCDTMGLEDSKGAGLDVDDISSILKGHMPDCYQEVSTRVGVPLSCVVPVKNYSGELELDLSCDILLLSAVIQMLRFVDNYFDELSDRLSSVGSNDLKSA